MVIGTVKSFNINKGWGFVTFQNKDIFLYVPELNGIVVKEGDKLNFTITQTDKGPQATNVKFMGGSPEKYQGKVKSFAWKSGYGFITTDAFPNQDIFFMKHDLSKEARDSVQNGSYCTFKIEDTDRGPNAKDVWLIGGAGKAVKKSGGGWGDDTMMQLMKMMMGKSGGKGVRKPMFQKK